MAIDIHRIKRQRKIISRKELSGQIADAIAEADTIASARPAILALLQNALAAGREEIAARLTKRPSAGYSAARAQAFLIDQIVRLSYDYIVQHVYPGGNRSTAERLALVAVGGYGRGEMAPHSDVDIAFITPLKRAVWTEQVVEAMLYLLWDLGLKVGQSSRSLDETVKMAQDDLTIRTALLESRFIWGDREVYEEAGIRFWNEVVGKTGPEFVSQKMEEREERHKRMGDSRYVVEPNIKDGKGGLRDLQTLYWIGKYLHRVKTAAELVKFGLFNEQEYRRFQKAEDFLWAVRCHMHDLAGRAEERLTFGMQRDVAQRMNYADRPGQSSVERFMQHYFLNAKTVGDLTGLFLAHLDDTQAKRGRRFIPSITRKPRKLNGFTLDRGRLNIPGEDFFTEDPVRLIEMFYLADKYEVEIHPMAIRSAQLNAKLIKRKQRNDPRANKLFLEILSSPRDPEMVLRWMNEATVFGRFIPDFGRVVAQMQFDMYHHYTVDEHTIRAVGLLSDIEAGKHEEDHPLATRITNNLISRRVLYVSVLLHDIAKGRGGDHSVLGAEVAAELCPRMGLSESETETVAWLVHNHLAMSATAFKRDLADFKTIQDFSQLVKSPERLKLLLVLTIVDITAVGPGVWNSWKRQLLTDLYDATEEMLRLGHKQRGRDDRVQASKDEVAQLLNFSEAEFTELSDEMHDSFWIAEPADIIVRNLALIRDNHNTSLAIDAKYYADRGATLVTVYAADHPGLFYRMAGAIHLAGGNIIDARIHTSRSGMAIDNFLVQDPFGRPFKEGDQIERLKETVGDALANKTKMDVKLASKPIARRRAEEFRIAPAVLVDNKASNRFTVVEVNAQDRPALLYHLSYALFKAKTLLNSAHIATYGERAVDTFYITDLLGGKIDSKARLKTLEKNLIEAVKASSEPIEEPA